MAIIQVENLSKQFLLQKRKAGLWGTVQSLFHREYQTKAAVDQISFQVEKGEMVGYIGPNGAGKSTTIKMLVGILSPTSGSVHVNGFIPTANRVQSAKRIGVVFGQRTQLWWDIPVSESLSLMRYMYEIPDSQYHTNMELFSEVLGIDEFIHTPVRQLSLGQRMRADLCASLLHNPDILFLDEPTIGLDVVVKQRIREFIKEVNRTRSTTVILTTHDMSDIENLCSRVIVIDKGKKMYDGDLLELKNQYGTEEQMIVETQSIISNIHELNSHGVVVTRLEANKTYLKYDKNRINSTKIIRWLLERHQVTDFVVKETNIEEIIINMYGGHSAKIAVEGLG